MCSNNYTVIVISKCSHLRIVSPLSTLCRYGIFSGSAHYILCLGLSYLDYSKETTKYSFLASSIQSKLLMNKP